MDFSKNLRHIRQRDFIKFKIISLRLLYSFVFLVKDSKRRIFLNKVSQLADIDEVQIVSHIRSRTLKVKVFYKDILGVFINLESRRDFRDVFRNTLNR